MSVSDPQTISGTYYSAALYQNLRQRANALLQELNAFEAHVKSHKKEKEVEIRVFKRGIESEVKCLQNLAPLFPDEEQSDAMAHSCAGTDSPHLHVLKSSNLPFYESVWNIAKSCSRVTALSKRFHWEKKGKDFGSSTDQGGSSGTPQPDKSKRQHQKGVLVDIVANNGLEWIKISTIAEKRLLFEIAKAGWESYTADPCEDDSNESPSQIGGTGQSPAQLELVRMAHELRAASNCARAQFQHPHVRFVLPNIREGQIGDIDAVVADLRATGATVQCSPTLPSSCLFPDGCTPVQIAILDQLLPGYGHVHLTGKINLDCTILLAVISDVSHLRREHIPSNPHALSGVYHSAILRQMEAEESRSMLWNDIYPLLADQTLQCTSQAAQRMREIVQCMGTQSERERADIILGEGHCAKRSARDLRQLLAKRSIHAVPPDLQLPIKVIDFEPKDVLNPLTPDREERKPFPYIVAAQAMSLMRLSPINCSVFLYGWKKQILTFTSNRVVASGLLKVIGEVLDRLEYDAKFNDKDHAKFYGPQIHICETARSLIGKAKNKSPGRSTLQTL
ncbi:uncharacterized protein A1O9_11024 [Exophiala aquamarina CBS 119918]|uniref:DUF1308 domain-containing protein n=1 Tax=Exophiala aquamarina CBS 119918 TaxID=1182545 RepID=A0A072NZT5_9EURO|nr:uncharacterized protein A1O9_11024 [Exophiala aquamarina CBS 119918]KEF53116.1 hypothetical protein A1O9_11024 [Exophiala aquamarina CBS 119918]